MNVVVICLDTFRADCLAALGRNPTVKTPNLDSFAESATVFENAVGEAQPTIQFRRGLATGIRAFPWRHRYDTRGLWPTPRGWHKIPPEYDTLAEVLLEHGYLTGLVADTYHMFKPTQNYTRGFTSFDFIRGQESDNCRTGPLSAIDVDRYRKPGREPHPVLVQYLLNMQDRKSEDDYLPARVFDSAIRYLHDNRDNGPFFLWVDSFDPHEPWDPPTRYADAYDPDWDAGWEPIFGWKDPDEVERRRVTALYYGECTFVDECIGRFFGELDRLDLTDDTVVAIVSDHGTELWDHGSLGKGAHAAIYRHNTEILCMIRFPGQEQTGARSPALVQNHDLMPTILGFLGIDYVPKSDAHLYGIDLRPLLRGEADEVREKAVTGWFDKVAVRSREFTYSANFELPALDEHLFNLNEDPGELRNLASRDPDGAAEHRAAAEALLGGPLPVKLTDETAPSRPPAMEWVPSRLKEGS